MGPWEWSHVRSDFLHHHCLCQVLITTRGRASEVSLVFSPWISLVHPVPSSQHHLQDKNLSFCWKAIQWLPNPYGLMPNSLLFFLVLCDLPHLYISAFLKHTGLISRSHIPNLWPEMSLLSLLCTRLTTPISQIATQRSLAHSAKPSMSSPSVEEKFSSTPCISCRHLVDF